MARNEIEDCSLPGALKQKLLEDVDSIKAVNVFIGSFSEDGDLLSQWRGYCPPGAGYSLGFTSQYLEQAAERSGLFYLGKCTYDRIEQIAVIRELVSVAVARTTGAETLGGAEGSEEDRKHPLWRMSFQDALAFAAPLLKHQKFSEEKEWRLISKPVDYHHAAFSHRPGKTYLLPYFRIPLSDDLSEHPVVLSRLVIGPTPHPELADDAIFSLLGAHKLLGRCDIAQSEIPFRAW